MSKTYVFSIMKAANKLEIPSAHLQKQMNMVSLSILESSSLVAEMTQKYQEAWIHYNFQNIVLCNDVM